MSTRSRDLGALVAPGVTAVSYAELQAVPFAAQARGGAVETSTRQTSAEPDPTTTSPRSQLRALVKCGRPHQWVKNTLVFVPIILAGEFHVREAVLDTLLCFVALCVIASGTYILNDILDVADDRKHWSKRFRPIASGALPIGTAAIAAPIIIFVGLVLGFLASTMAGVALLTYLALTLAYSMGLKRVAMLDVAALASLFTLRLVVGIMAAHVPLSHWLLTFSMFLFTSLCLAKRYVEVEGASRRGQKAVSGRGYRAEDAPLLMSVGLSTGIASIVIMVLYIMFDAFDKTFYDNSEWLWGFPAILFLWISRIWLKAARRQLDDDPIAFAVTDLPSIVLGVGMLATFLIAWL
ncbi:UbiA family prenyltransferase [Hyphomicrobium sp.]|uniref:UbiA family prenyltransferase n=1 Tax=Hyphomicrobium sp. TaxID=82 RepID=UPI0025BBFC4D|nr:UbiA family prenyltransferase [Hyphomicrobium sp.]MCC7250789.1 UbiA family prenyltransferase [Hyphomicrobium sp.]